MRPLVVALTIALAFVAPEVHAALFRPVPGPSKPRRQATLTTLTDGQILLTGGQSGISATVASTEVFDPKTDTWKAVFPLNNPRLGHGAVRLNDGRVLVAGGVEQLGKSVLVSEIFDPVTGIWTNAAVMRSSHYPPFALATDGRVGVLGGNTNGSASADFEIYDPITDVWKVSPGSTYSYARHVLAALPSGGFLAAGGESAAGSERFDATTNRWTTMGTIERMEVPSAVTLKDDRVLIVGGGTFEGNGLPLLFDPKTGAFRTLVGQRLGEAPPVALLPDGRVFVLGTRPLTPMLGALIELFDPATSTMRVLGNVETSLPDALVAVVDAEHVLIVSNSYAAVVTIPKSCSVASECSTGFCVDGVCCDGACNGQCEACDVAGFIGTCTGVAGAPHGKRGACAEPWTPGCRAKTCDGSRDRNACVEPVFKPVCDCSRDADCTSGHCVDGVCCNTACAGQCEACDLPGSRGVCVPVTGEPRGIRKGCVPPGLGICTVQACDGTDTTECKYIHKAETNCDTICGGRVSRHCDGEGGCGLGHELKCPDNSCSTASPQPTERPRFLDALFVLGLALGVRRGARAWRGAPRPSCPRRDR